MSLIAQKMAIGIYPAGRSDHTPSILLFLILLCQVIATPGFINPQENQMHAEKLFEQMKAIELATRCSPAIKSTCMSMTLSIFAKTMRPA
jgi:hypothetical membrane protein